MLRVFENRIQRAMAIGRKLLECMLNLKCKFFDIDRTRYAYAKSEPSGINIVNEDRDEGNLLINDYDALSDSSSVKIFVDYQNSKGNYIVDADGNTILDMVSGGGHLPLGYNHQAFIKIMNDKLYDAYIQNNLSLTFTPPTEYVDLHRKVLHEHKPHESLDQVHLYSDISGSLANENAIRAAMIKHHYSGSDKVAYWDGIQNPNRDYCVIAFSGANHGSTMATLSLSNNPQKLNLPMKDWHIVDFPDSSADEGRALEDYEEILNEHKGKVAAVIVSPIQALTYQSASGKFYNQLREMAYEYDTSFIVDETFTGCGATGHFWGHETWNLERAPDMVTFGRRTQASGVYLRKDFIPKHASWEFFTNKSGDPLKLLQYGVIQDVIHQQGLLQKVHSSGRHLKTNLETIDNVSNIRGIGTMIAFDSPDEESNSQLYANLMYNGVNIARAGPKSLAVRPSLLFEEKHSKEFLSTLRKSLR